MHVATYDCESWTLKKNVETRLAAFETTDSANEQCFMSSGLRVLVFSIQINSENSGNCDMKYLAICLTVLTQPTIL